MSKMPKPLQEVVTERVVRLTGRRVRDLLTAALILQGGVTDRAAAATQAWIVVVAIEHLAIRWVLDDTEIPRDQLVAETVALVTGYLTP